MCQTRTVVRGGGGRSSGSWAWAALAAAAFGPAALAQAQAPPVPPPGALDVPAPARVSDLSTRYRFIERYAPAVSTAAPQPGEIGQYRVATRDVIRVVSEKEQGAPDRKETTVQVIYTEKPVSVNSMGAVTAMVRRYDAYRVTPPPEVKPSVAPRTPLEGLTVWVQPQPKSGGRPLLVSLTENRSLSETEYTISSQRLIFLPDLAGALPALPSRVGDRWAVSAAAAQALLGDRPTAKGPALVGELIDVRKTADKPEMVAEVRVTGHALMPPKGIDMMVNAQIRFTFAAPAAAPEGAPAGASSTTVDARGAITELRLARSSVSAVGGGGGGGAPNGNNRLRRTFTLELTLQRDLSRPGDPLPVPSKPPAATPDNSWVTYDDPQGRFRFRHPQDLRPRIDPEAIEKGIVELFDDRAGTLEGRVVTITLQAKTGDPQEDRNNLDPEYHKKELEETWVAARRDVLHGPAGWLPEADWKPLKMKVYRIEAADKPSGVAHKDTPRVFFDYYLVLFSQNESIVVQSFTGQDPPLPFRKEVEEILKTFVLNPAPKPAR